MLWNYSLTEDELARIQAQIADKKSEHVTA
jgi:hypothetical protein